MLKLGVDVLEHNTAAHKYACHLQYGLHHPLPVPHPGWPADPPIHPLPPCLRCVQLQVTVHVPEDEAGSGGAAPPDGEVPVETLAALGPAVLAEEVCAQGVLLFETGGTPL